MEGFSSHANYSHYKQNYISKKLIPKTKDFFQKISHLNRNNSPNKNSNLLRTLSKPGVTIDQFLKRILNSQDLKSYQLIQVIIHKKGDRTCKSFTYNRSEEYFETPYEVASFNSLFNTLKKSKNKIFDQTSLESKLVSSIGTFLAKTANFFEHSVIIVVSRNDFLRPAHEEMQLFNQYSYLICHYLSTMYSSLNTLHQYDFYTKILNEINTLPSKDLNKNKEDLSSLAPEFYHFERLQVLGELLNTLKHELSNPLFGINLSLQLVKDETPLELDEEFNALEQNCRRCEKIIDEYSAIYTQSDNYKSVNLEKLLQNSTVLAKSFTKPSSIKIAIHNGQPDSLIFRANPTWLSQIFFNLIINSAQSLENHDVSEKKIDITWSFDFVESKTSILFSDNGPGIPNDIKGKIFNEFFTTKDCGTGLGLAVCKNLMNKIGGEISLEKTSKLGTIFKLIIPVNLYEQDTYS